VAVPVRTRPTTTQTANLARRRPRRARLADSVPTRAQSVPLYVGLAKSGLIRSPFFPRVDGDLALAKSDKPGLRVLFVGNSFTYYHSMPELVHELAEHDAGRTASLHRLLHGS
jgi:hypothetical protein